MSPASLIRKRGGEDGWVGDEALAVMPGWLDRGSPALALAAKLKIDRIGLKIDSRPWRRRRWGKQASEVGAQSKFLWVLSFPTKDSSAEGLAEGFRSFTR